MTFERLRWNSSTRHAPSHGSHWAARTGTAYSGRRAHHSEDGPNDARDWPMLRARAESIVADLLTDALEHCSREFTL